MRIRSGYLTRTSRRRVLLRIHPFRGRGVDHQQEALLGRGKLGDVMLRVSPPDMLLHRTISFFLGEIRVSEDICRRIGAHRQ